MESAVDQSANEVWILGNGPSLRGFDFSNFNKSPTLGMNAAYRYWRRIDWRPTYYCCLDDALIDTHKDAILEMVEEGRIKAFFLTARMLEYFPKLSSNPSVHYIDEFVQHWHRVRGSEFGLQFVEHSAFNTNAPDMLTTGAYAVRFAAFLGYQSVRLLGIDLTYHSVSEARELEGTRLIMDSTPDENPNYFFGGYQQAGDQFNVANPDQHGRELHLHSFLALRDDFLREGVEVSLENSSLGSKLFQHGVLPYAPWEQRSAPSGSPKQLVLNVYDERPDLVESVLWLWSQPGFFPVLGRRRNVVDLVIETGSAASPTIERMVTRFMKRNPSLRACFRDVKTLAGSGAASYSRSQMTPETDTTCVIDADTIPVSCDWLNRPNLWDDSAAPSLEIDVSADALPNILSQRIEAPLSVFLKARGVSRRLREFRSQPGSKTFDRLFQPDLWSSDKRARVRLTPMKRKFSPRSILSALFK